MPALEKAFGYQGDNMNLPVADIDAALPYYRDVLGFEMVSRSDAHPRSAVLARDHVRMRIAENGGDPTQDGCAFHVTDVQALHDEYSANGLVLSPLGVEQMDGADWNVFYVVAPDGLCYWFGERATS